MRHYPITQANWSVALELLCEGFPETDTQFWQRGLDRWASMVGDPFKQPIGFLTQDEAGNSQSVLLTFNSPHLEGAAKRTNFSSWYVKESHRSRAALLLKKLSSDQETIYTDFTPNASVEQILRRLKYSEYRSTHLGFWTPLVSFGKGLDVVSETSAQVGIESDQYLKRAIGDHLSIGCILLGLMTANGIAPVLMRLKKRKRIVTTAEVIFCEDVRNIENHLPALCRHLWKRGVFILECEFPHMPHHYRPSFNWGEVSRFIKGSWDENRVDCLYSEIPILGVS